MESPYQQSIIIWSNDTQQSLLNQFTAQLVEVQIKRVIPLVGEWYVGFTVLAAGRTLQWGAPRSENSTFNCVLEKHSSPTHPPLTVTWHLPSPRHHDVIHVTTLRHAAFPLYLTLNRRHSLAQLNRHCWIVSIVGQRLELCGLWNSIVSLIVGFPIAIW